MQKIAVVTGNTKKYHQIAKTMERVAQPHQVVCDLDELQNSLLEEVSQHKCVQAWESLHQPLLVDDSGIYFEQYQNFPGSLTKRLYDGIGLEGIRRLFQSGDSLKATFQCVISYMDESLDMPQQFIGEAKGELCFDYLGKRDEDPKLPYDLIFKPEGLDDVAAFHMDVWTTQLNHRIKATEKFVERLERERI